jgi:putative flavoprotein involved in K+ transport
VGFWAVEGGFLDVRRELIVLPSRAIPGRALQGSLETLSLQLLSALGVVLLGKVESAQGKVLTFSADVSDNIRFADDASAALQQKVDDYIKQAGIRAPAAIDDPAEVAPAKIPSPPITSLDLEDSGISTIMWCTGFYGDFSWLRVPGTLSDDLQPRRIGAVSGLYFPVSISLRLAHPRRIERPAFAFGGRRPTEVSFGPRPLTHRGPVGATSGRRPSLDTG